MYTRLGKTIVAGLAGMLLAVFGCHPDRPAPGPQPTERPLAGTELHLVVVDDPPLAAALQRLRGEWSIRTGGEFRVHQSTAKEFLAATRKIPGDAVICPSADLGPAVERKLALPLDGARGPSVSAALADVFELPRVHELTWGGRIYAVPFGSPTLVCYCRADLLGKLGRSPPQTWTEYLELARLMAQRAGPGKTAKEASWHATAEPLGPGWAGLTLLARAAPYAKHRHNYSTLFNIDTMEPLIDGPPFRRALEELIAAAKFGPAEQLDWGPADVRKAFWQGRSGLAIAWPTAAEPQVQTPAPAIQAVFAELPGSKEVYDVGRATWDARAEEEDQRIPLLGISGRVGLVAATSAHPDAAVELLVWLSITQPDDPPTAASPSTTLFRRAHLRVPSAWVEQPARSAAAQYAATVQRTLSRTDCLLAPRIPGRSEYLAVLDDAVRRAVQGKSGAPEVLEAAAQQWRAITRRLGLADQRATYRRSLGLEP